MSLTRHDQSTENKFAYLCKKWGMYKSIGDEVNFLPADKHKSSPQDDSITLGVRIKTCPKYQKEEVCNIFAIFQGKCEGWSWFFAWMLKFAISLQHVKKEMSNAVAFLHADKHGSLLQVDTKIFWGG